MRRFVGVLFVIACHGCGKGGGSPAAAVDAGRASPVQAAAERWSGRVEVPGQPFEFEVRWIPAPGGASKAQIAIPAQELPPTKLGDVRITAEELDFTLNPPGAPAGSGARFHARRQTDADTAEGEMSQGSQTFPLHMHRLAAGEAVGLRRPQTPKPPYPYPTRDVSYTDAKDGTRLAGTLTLPAGEGKHPAILLITGSGLEDRDETLFGHKPFLVIADHLARHGVAVLRVDDRGAGGSGGSPATTTLDDEAADVASGVAFLKTQPEIYPTQIGLCGHSEGGVVAAQVAAGSKDVAFVILLASAGLPGYQILGMQARAIRQADGMPPDQIESAMAAHKRVMDLVLADASEAQLRPAVAELIERQTANLPAAARTPEAKAKLVDTTLAQVISPPGRALAKADPRPSLRKVHVPVLALNGDRDLQNPPKEDLEAIRAALAEGGNHDVETVLLPKLNHLFQTATTGSPNEYAGIEETFAPSALDALTDWLGKHTHPFHP